MSVHNTHKNRFLLILQINLVVFIGELLVALYSGSLTMLSDSLHVSIHIVAPFLAYISEYEFGGISGKSIKKWTAGINIILFFVLAAGIAYEARERLSLPPQLRLGPTFFVVAILGLVANIYSANILHNIEDDECEQNVKPLFWHMVFDSAGSVIVIVGAVLMYVTHLFILDPILSFILAGLISVGAIFMFRNLILDNNHGHHH